MTNILVPFHQDERLSDTYLPLPGSAAAETVEVAFPDGDIWVRLVALCDAVAEKVAARESSTVVSGDCLVALGTIAGVQRAGIDPSVVWFDAHGDVHTLASSTSGYLGGLALRLALGAHRELLADPLGLRPLAERDALLVDARDLDPAEQDYLSASELRSCAVEELQTPKLPEGPLVLHIDVDVIGGLPGMSFAAPGGPSQRAVLEAARRVVDTGRVRAVNIACPWNPARDEHETRIREALLTELLALTT